MTRDRANRIRRLLFNEELSPSDVDGSNSYEELNEISDRSTETYNLGRAESTSILVSEATATPEVVVGKKMAVRVQEATASSKCKETAGADLVNANYAFIEDSEEEMNEFEKKTLLSSKSYKLDVRPIQSDEVHHLIAEVLNTGLVQTWSENT